MIGCAASTSAHRSTAMLHEMHHTDARDYKGILKQMMELLEGLRAKLGASSSSIMPD